MPTNQNAYNSRVTDEALEKKFRDTFKSQGGAELVDDLYASGVIVPVVDFTSAAEGSALRQDLQSAWDFSTDLKSVAGFNSTLTTTTGFWQIGLTCAITSGTYDADIAHIELTDGLTVKKIWQMGRVQATDNNPYAVETTFVVFIKAGESVVASSASTAATLSLWYRQIADVYGNLTNPLGFTSS